MLWQRGKAYSQDLRDRVFAAAAAGMPVGRIAAMLFVSGPYVSKVLIGVIAPAKLRPGHSVVTSRPSWATITRRSGSGWRPNPMRRSRSFGAGCSRRTRFPSA